MKKRLDDRGAALVLIIVVIAFVSILVSTSFLAATINMQMRHIDHENKENFYSAEGALEQITAGLQKEIAASSEGAYLYVMQRYTADNTEQLRRRSFNNLFVVEMNNRLQTAESELSSTTKYVDREKLLAYIDPKLVADGQILTIGTTIEVPDTDPNAVAVIDTSISGTIGYKGLKIEYMNKDGYLSVIETDLRLTIPNPNFVQTSTVPELFSYSMIANTGMNIDNANTEINGNVYAGADGLTIRNGSPWFNEGDRLVVAGDANIDSGANVTFKSCYDIWAENINVSGSSFETAGSTYVADDLVLSNSNSSVKLGDAYYGYGNGNKLDTDATIEYNAGNRSAILINGTDSTLDFYDVKRLLIAGSAEIATSKVTYSYSEDGRTVTQETDPNSNITLGEAVEVKSNQLAYLVPEELIGVAADGTVVGGKNPMTIEEYNFLLDEYERDGSGFQIVSLTKKISSLKSKKTLGEFASTNADRYKKVFHNTVSTGTLVYFYVDLNQDALMEYFQDYYGENKSELNTYMDHYISNITLSPSWSRINLNGNLLYSDASTGVVNIDTVSDAVREERYIQYMRPESKVYLNAEEESFMNIFQALSHKVMLDNDLLSSEERGRTVYQNVINSNAMTFNDVNETLGSLNTSGTLFYTEDDLYAACIVRNDYTYTGSEPRIRLIVADGDVTLDADYKGIVIASGKITVTGNCHKIESDEPAVGKVLQIATYANRLPITKASGENIRLVEQIFVDGEKYSLGVSEDAPVQDTDFVEYTELIRYENYNKN